MTRSFYTILFLLLFVASFSQQKYELAGIIKSLSDNSLLSGANIFIQPGNYTTSTNADGEFSITLEKGNYTVDVSYMGFKTYTQSVSINNNTKLQISISEFTHNIDDVVINSEVSDRNIRSSEVGSVHLKAEDISAIPILFGEPDIIQTAKLMPGVQAGGEGNPGIFVRGGDAGQNLILLDNMRLYNPSHLMGFFPVFNSSTVNSIKVYKGAIPANYGGGSASVFEIQQKTPDLHKFKVNGSLGFIHSDLTLETPIISGRCALIISARRTYLELYKAAFINNSSDSRLLNSNYYFYDTNAKLIYKLTDKTRMYITAYGGYDEYLFSDISSNMESKLNWGNTAMAFMFNHIQNPNFYFNIGGGYTKYSSNINISYYSYSAEIESAISDYNFNCDISYNPNQLLSFKSGLQYLRHKITPDNSEMVVDEIKFSDKNIFNTNEYSYFISSDLNLNTRLNLTSGLRYTIYNHVGPYSFIEQSDTLQFAYNENVKLYHGLSPTISATYIINNQTSIKASASKTKQFVHLGSAGSVSFPTDMWLSSSRNIKPLNVSIATLGFFRNYNYNMFETSIEVYYKHTNNQLDFINSTLDFVTTTDLNSNIIQGTGKSYGLELYFKKQIGTFTGWCSYTLSRTTRSFSEINYGKTFPAKYDRTHDLSVTGSVKINKHWSASALFIFATGNAMTLPIGRYIIQGNIANVYSEPNKFRMPNYHRLDLSVNYKLISGSRFESDLNFSVYNVYNRHNIYFMYYNASGDLDRYRFFVKPESISLFPVLPSLSWNFKF